jgi:hypothetical protein
MSSKRPRKYLGQKLKYVGLPHWLLRCPAWRALPHAARSLYIEGLELRYNSCNNGDIRLGVREAAEIIGATSRGQCSLQYALNMLRALTEHGFVKPRVKGAFHVKTRFATRWILTRYEREGRPATMDFMQWKPTPKPPEKFKQRFSWEQQTVLLGRTDEPADTPICSSGKNRFEPNEGAHGSPGKNSISIPGEGRDVRASRLRVVGSR